jgi:pyruvate formate lyase activating enzyme
MKIGSFQKSSLIDFPGKVAAVVYTQGCQWRCPYCNARSLVYPTRFQPAIPIEEVIDQLLLHQEQLQGVVITGGEPTLQTGLADFIRQVKNTGLAVKLDTNGAEPEVLGDLLHEGLLDYIAMDVKGPLHDYARFVGGPVDTGKIELSIEIIKQSKIPYEFRTTLVGGLHDTAHIRELAPLMYGVERYALQTFKAFPGDTKSSGTYSTPDTELFHTASMALRDKVAEFLVR